MNSLLRLIREFEKLKVLIEQYIQESPDFPNVQRGWDLARKMGSAMGDVEVTLKTLKDIKEL